MQYQRKEARGVARAVRWAFTVGLSWGAAAYGAEVAKPAGPSKPDAAKPAAAKPDKNAVKNSVAAVQAAVAALQKEVLAHNGPDKTPLREKSNYFTENAPKDPILPETIVQALLPTYSPDSPSDSYIKWQLLSGAPPKFEGDLAHAASQAYLKAGKPLPRPGLSPADKKQLMPLVKDVKTPEDAEAIAKKLAALIDPWEEKNKLVLAYRDDLYSRLPQDGDALVARLEDDAQRVEAGYESEKEMKITTDAIGKWADTNPPAAHLKVMADKVKAWWYHGKPQPTASAGGGKMNYGGGKYSNSTYGEPTVQFPPKYYQDIEFDSKTNKWQWADRGARQIRKDDLDALVVTLEDAAKTAKKNEDGMAKK